MSKNYCKIGKIWCKNCSHHGCKYNLIQPSLNNIRPLNALNTCPKRNNDRTISFKELIMNSTFNDIMNAMYVHHHDEKKNIDGYKQAFHILKNMKPIKPSFNMYICLNTVIDESNADLLSNTFKYFIIYLKNYNFNIYYCFKL